MFRNLKYKFGGLLEPFNLILAAFILAVLVGCGFYLMNTINNIERYDTDEVVSESLYKAQEYYDGIAARDKKMLVREGVLEGDTQILEIGTLPEDTKIYVKNFKRPGIYCLYAINPNGNASAEGAGIIKGNAPQCSNTKNPEKNFKPQDVVDAVNEF